MLLYLKEEPVSGVTSLVRVSPGETLPAAGDVLDGQTQGYLYSPSVQNEIIRNSRLTLTVPVVVNGTITIRPRVIIVDSDPGTPDIEIYGGDEREVTAAGGSTTLIWQTMLGSSEPLANRNIKVTLEVNNDPVTLGVSTLDVDLREGSIEGFSLWATAVFTHFQKTEKAYLYHEVDVKEVVQIPIWHRVQNIEDVSFQLWHEVAAVETISLDLMHEVQGLIHPDTPSNRITNLKINDLILFDGPRLRRQSNLGDIVEMIEPPPSVEVPSPVTRDAKESPLSHAGEALFHTVNLLRADEDQVVAHKNLEIFEPSGLYGGTVDYDEDLDEWRLPRGHMANQVYYLQFPTLEIGAVSKTLWFMLRHRDEGGILSAFLRGEPGSLVFQGNVTATDEVRVWCWTEASYPFDVTLYVQNPSASGPGFSGTLAAMMAPL